MTALRSYTLQADLAKQVGVSNRITRSGKYIGRFIRAELVTSRQKSEGVEFTFESTDGQTADFLTCWTHNVDGRELYGLKVLMAILTCLRLRGIQAKPGRVAERGGGTRDARIFPELTDRPIGLVLQREEYLKQDGAVGWKFNIVAPFEATTGATAGEVLAGEPNPSQLDRMISGLQDKTLPRNAGGGAGYEHASTSHPANGGGYGSSFGSGLGDIDDDIPF